MKKTQNKLSPVHSFRLILPIVLLVVSMVAIILFTQHTQDIRSKASESNTPWIESQTDVVRENPWFLQYAYADCPENSGDLWPQHQLDCLIPESALVKHLTPTSMFTSLPEIIRTMIQTHTPDTGKNQPRARSNRVSTIVKNVIQKRIITQPKQQTQRTNTQFLFQFSGRNPSSVHQSYTQLFSNMANMLSQNNMLGDGQQPSTTDISSDMMQNILSQLMQGDTSTVSIEQFTTILSQYASLFNEYSFSSLLLEIEDNTVLSAALMIHPDLEAIIVNALGTEIRANTVFHPFVEAVTGQRVSTDDVHELYTAGLYACGKSAQPNVPSQEGMTKQFGVYTATLQSLSVNDGSGDCNILIQKTL